MCVNDPGGLILSGPPHFPPGQLSAQLGPHIFNILSRLRFWGHISCYPVWDTLAGAPFPYTPHQTRITRLPLPPPFSDALHLFWSPPCRAPPCSHSHPVKCASKRAPHLPPLPFLTRRSRPVRICSGTSRSRCEPVWEMRGVQLVRGWVQLQSQDHNDVLSRPALKCTPHLRLQSLT